MFASLNWVGITGIENMFYVLFLGFIFSAQADFPVDQNSRAVDLNKIQKRKDTDHPLRSLLEFHLERHGCDEFNPDNKEHQQDLEMFAKAHQKILKLNEQSDGTVIFGHNHLSTWTDQEKKQLLGFKVSEDEFNRQSKHRKREAVNIGVIKEALAKKNIPLKLDWRQKPGVVLPIRDQGRCTTCYSFSSSDTIAMLYALKYNKTAVPLSVQYVADCVRKAQSCSTLGDYMDVYKALIKSKNGVPSEDELPYKQTAQTYAAQCDNQFSDSKYPKVTAFDRLKKAELDETGMFEYLQKGPINVCVEAGDPFKYYKTGVFKGNSCNKPVCNHAIMLVGYDLTESPPYYILRNSFNPGWGEKGYMKIEAGQNTCGVAYIVAQPTVQ